jgi:hypothetical protein
MELVSGLGFSQSLILQQYVDTRAAQDLRAFGIGGWLHAVMLHPCTTSSFKASINRGGRWLRPWRRCSELLPVG